MITGTGVHDRTVQPFKITGMRSIAIDADAWRRFPKNLRKSFGDAQNFCCSRLIRHIVDHLDECGLNETLMSIAFDQDFEFAKSRLRLFKEVIDIDPRLKNRVAQISFANAQKYYPLQAADLLAWETRRKLVAETGGLEPNARWSELMAIMPHGRLRYVSEMWNEEHINAYLPAVVREFSGGSWIQE